MNARLFILLSLFLESIAQLQASEDGVRVKSISLAEARRASLNRRNFVVVTSTDKRILLGVHGVADWSYATSLSQYNASNFSRKDLALYFVAPGAETLVRSDGIKVRTEVVGRDLVNLKTVQARLIYLQNGTNTAYFELIGELNQSSACKALDEVRLSFRLPTLGAEARTNIWFLGSIPPAALRFWTGGSTPPSEQEHARAKVLRCVGTPCQCRSYPAE